MFTRKLMRTLLPVALLAIACSSGCNGHRLHSKHAQPPCNCGSSVYGSPSSQAVEGYMVPTPEFKPSQQLDSPQSLDNSPTTFLPTLPPLPSAKGRTLMPVLNVENNAHRFYDPGMTPPGTDFERVETYGRPVPPETQSRNLLQQFGNGLKNIFKPASRRRLPHHVSAPEWNGSFSETDVQPLAQYKRIPLSGGSSQQISFKHPDRSQSVQLVKLEHPEFPSDSKAP